MVTRTRAEYEIRAVDKTRAAILSAQRNISSLDRTFKRFAGGLAGLAGGIGLGIVARQIDEISASAQRLTQTSQNLNFPVEDLQRYQVAARRAGVDTGQLETAFQRMVRRVSQAADGTGEAQDALEELGLSARQLESLNTAEQFENITRALEPLAEPDKVRLLQKIFDSEGVRAVQNTANAIKEVGDEFDRLALSAEELQDIQRVRDLFDRVGEAATAMGSKAVASLGDMIEMMGRLLSRGEEVVELANRAGRASGIQRSLQEAAERRRAEEEAGIVRPPIQIRGRMPRAEYRDSGPTTRPRIGGLREDERGPISRPTLSQHERAIAQAVESRRNRQAQALAEERAQEEAARAATEARTRALEEQAIAWEVNRQRMNEFFMETPAVEEWRLDLEGVAAITDAVADRQERLKSTVQDLGLTFTSAFEDAIIEGEKLSVILEGLLKDIARLVIRKSVTENLATGIDSLFGQAYGGISTPNKMAIVGERGPELFVPGGAGVIVPNNRLGGGSSNVTFNINAIDSQSFQNHLAQNRKLVVGMIREAHERQGRRPAMS